ncbi:MAG: HPF/RaiA family ribosome-associated protein [Phycisphaerales bacterium JB039]
MQIQMNFGRMASSDALSEHITREVESALEHISDRITRVEVHVQDTNAGKGGVDKRVLMEARPAGLDPIAVDEHGADVYLTVRSVAEKLRTALTRRFDKLADTHGG